MPKGQTLPLQGLKEGTERIMAETYKPDELVTRSANQFVEMGTPKVQLGTDLLEKTIDPTITGKQYARIRSELGKNISTAPGHSMVPLRDMQRLLDAKVGRAIPVAERKAYEQARKNYHLINALNKQVIDPAKGFDLKKAHSQLARAGKKQSYPKEVMRMLDDIMEVAPPLSPVQRGLEGGATLASLAVPAKAALVAAVTGVPYLALKTGVPQYLANNPTSRTAVAAALRGKTTSELNEE